MLRNWTRAPYVGNSSASPPFTAWHGTHHTAEKSRRDGRPIRPDEDHTVPSMSVTKNGGADFACAGTADPASTTAAKTPKRTNLGASIQPSKGRGDTYRIRTEGSARSTVRAREQPEEVGARDEQRGGA